MGAFPPKPRLFRFHRPTHTANERGACTQTGSRVSCRRVGIGMRSERQRRALGNRTLQIKEGMPSALEARRTENNALRR